MTLLFELGHPKLWKIRISPILKRLHQVLKRILIDAGRVLIAPLEGWTLLCMVRENLLDRA
jgi:hypothetical protein